MAMVLNQALADLISEQIRQPCDRTQGHALDLNEITMHAEFTVGRDLISTERRRITAENGL